MRRCAPDAENGSWSLRSGWGFSREEGMRMRQRLFFIRMGPAAAIHVQRSCYYVSHSNGKPQMKLLLYMLMSFMYIKRRIKWEHLPTCCDTLQDIYNNIR